MIQIRAEFEAKMSSDVCRIQLDEFKPDVTDAKF